MAPKGKTELIVSLLMDYELVKKVSNDGWYNEFKELTESLIIKSLKETIYLFIDEKNNIQIHLNPVNSRKNVWEF
jgi:hypothetical protein